MQGWFDGDLEWPIVWDSSIIDTDQQISQDLLVYYRSLQLSVTLKWIKVFWPIKTWLLVNGILKHDLGFHRENILFPSQGLKNQLQVKLSIVSCPPVTTVLIKRPDLKFQLGFSVQNGIVSMKHGLVGNEPAPRHLFKFLFIAIVES